MILGLFCTMWEDGIGHNHIPGLAAILTMVVAVHFPTVLMALTLKEPPSSNRTLSTLSSLPMSFSMMETPSARNISSPSLYQWRLGFGVPNASALEP